MAVIITAGADGDIGTYTAIGPTEIIVSGPMDGCSVGVSVDGGAGQAPVYNFSGQGAVLLQTAAGTIVTCEVSGGVAPAVNVAAA